MGSKTPTIARDRPSGLDDVGTLPSGSTGMQVREYGTGPYRMVEIEVLEDYTITLTDETGVVAYGSREIYNFPEGDITIFAAVKDVDIVGGGNVIAAFDGDTALGSAPATTGNTLTGTEADILPSTATPQAVASVTTANGRTIAVSKQDGTTTAAKVYDNYIVDDADHNGGTITIKAGSKYWISYLVGGNY